MTPKFIIEHHTTSGWEEAPGFCLHATLPGAIKELAEFILDTHEEYRKGRMSQPYNIEEYRICLGDNIVAQFGDHIIGQT
jgi:hypothetical protein